MNPTDKRHVASAERYLKTTELCLKQGKMAKAKQNCDYAHKSFERISEEGKVSEEGSVLSARFRELESTLSTVGSNEKKEPDVNTKLKDSPQMDSTLNRVDKKNIISTRNNLRSISRSLEKGTPTGAQKYFSVAKDCFSKVSPEGQASVEGRALAAELEEQEIAIESLIKAVEEEKQLNALIREQDGKYSEFGRKYDRVINILQYTQSDISTNSNFPLLEKIKDSYDDLMENDPDQLHQEWAELIEHDTQKGPKAEKKIEVLRNGQSYRDKLVELVCRTDVDRFVEKQFLPDLTEIQDKDKQYASFSYFEDIYGEKANKNFEVVDHVEHYYNWINQPAPEELTKKVNAYKDILRDAVIAKAKISVWDEGRYSYQSDVMTELIANSPVSKEMEFIQCSSEPLEKWTIMKNELGIPLCKRGQGYMIFQKEGEPVKRGYVIVLERVYNGWDFEDVSVWRYGGAGQILEK